MSDTTKRPTGTATMQGELWGAHARDWAELQEVFFKPLYQHVLARPELANATSMLDVGCGAGLAMQVFGTKMTQVCGLDASPALAEIARERNPKADIRVGEMEELPFGDAMFDVVTGFNSFQYAASPANALRQARRVSKPNGVVVIATWGMPEDTQAAGHLKALGGLMPPPPPGAPGPFALSEPARLEGLAKEAGLNPVNITDVACPWVYRDLDTALRAMLSAGPAERAIKNSGIDKAREAVAESIKPYRQADGSYRLENKFRYLLTRV